MKYLWGNIADIQKSLSACDKIILLLDFDGTLVPISPHPKKVHLTKELKKLLLSIKSNPNLYLGIVSGRKLSNIKDKIDIDNIIFVGSHGWEWEIAGKKNSLQLNQADLRLLYNLKQKIQKLAQQFSGVTIEDKYCSFSVHYRFAAQPKLFQDAFLSLIKESLLNKQIRIMEGKKVYDMLPNHDWRKGHTVSLIIDRLNKLNKKNHLLYIYIGDDTTDEKVFSMHSKIMTIRVGKNIRSKAKYYVKNTSEVRKLLELIKNFHPNQN